MTKASKTGESMWEAILNVANGSFHANYLIYDSWADSLAIRKEFPNRRKLPRRRMRAKLMKKKCWSKVVLVEWNAGQCLTQHLEQTAVHEACWRVRKRKWMDGVIYSDGVWNFFNGNILWSPDFLVFTQRKGSMKLLYLRLSTKNSFQVVLLHFLARYRLHSPVESSKTSEHRRERRWELQL